MCKSVPKGEAPARSKRQRGLKIGSPYYAAPEQEADPASADERADVFSAGVTLFRCLTGRLPQEGLAASALRQGLDAVYLGYWIKNCKKMSYKTQYRPIELLINQRWVTLN